jgi:hypothetical protein
MFQTKFVEKTKTILFNNSFFLTKLYRLRDNVEKHGRARQAIDDNMAYARCTLDTYAYKHTLRIRNT